MRTIKGEFYVSTGYVGSDRRDDFEIEVEEFATEEEVDNIIQEDFNIWLWNVIDAGWNIKE